MTTSPRPHPQLRPLGSDNRKAGLFFPALWSYESCHGDPFTMTRSMLSLKDDMSLETSLPHEDGDPEIPSLKSKLQLKQLGALFVTALTQQEDGAEDGARYVRTNRTRKL